MTVSVRNLDVGGVFVAVEDHGDGVPCLLLHGFPLSSEIFAPVRPALETVARVITPDLPGFGRSAKPLGGYTMEGLAAVVGQMADALGLDRFVLGGHSMGGYVAMRVAAAMRERLAALILIDTRAAADAPEARERRQAAMAAIGRGEREAFLDGFAGNLVGISTRTRAPRIVEELRRLADDVPDHALIGALAGMRERPDSTETLAGLAVPALLVVGEEDTVTPPAEMAALAQRMPRGELAVIPAAGHTPTVERPVATAEVLVAFLSRIAARS